jgi:hypothetical protein
VTEQATTTTGTEQTAAAGTTAAATDAAATTASAPTGEQTTAQAAAATQTSEVPDWAKDPAAAIAEVQKARQEAAAARTSSRDKAKADARTELLKELGLTKDDEPADPAKLAADLQATRTTATEAQRELALYRNAPKDVDVQALLDSRDFLKTVSSIDPSDSAALVAAITTASQNPRFRTVQAPGSSGVDLAGGDQTQRTYTRAQLRDPAFYKAHKSDILAAQREGRIHN